MTKISGVVITFNEEKKIEQCIKSLLPICEEVVVIDSFSTDSTVEIAESLGAKVIKHPFENYREQKNYALSCIRHEWALSLDADEVLSLELQKSVLLVKEKPDADGYTMNRLTNYCGKWIKHCGWYPDRKIRLFKTGKAHWGGGILHEKVEMNTNSVIHHLKGDLLHYSFDSHHQYVAQQQKFAEMAAENMHQLHKHYSWPLVFAKTAFRFFRDYVIKAGFLEGTDGLKICIVSAGTVFRKYSLLKKLSKTR